MYITPAYNKKPKFVDYSSKTTYSQILSVQSRGDVFDYRSGIPSNATYTRTGAATGLTSAGVILSFAADAPQRTDRGLLLEPARTNLLIKSQAIDTWTQAGNTTTTANQTVAPDGTTTAELIASTASNACRAYRAITVTTSTAIALSIFLKTGTNDGNINYSNGGGGNVAYGKFTLSGAGATAINGGASSASILALANGWYYSSVILTTGTANGIVAVGPWDGSADQSNYPAVNSGGKNVSAWQVQAELGAFPTSPIPTDTVTATRGLPVFTEPVPAGRTKALLTYADASTTLVTGLTPGGTFDVATAVLGANKGRFGASELIRREWQA